MFYDRYVALCKAAGLSASAAAIKAGINKGTISVWKKKSEQGIDVDPDKATIERLCAFFNISEAELRGVSVQAQKKDPAVPGEVSPAKQALLNMIDDMSEEQLAKLLPIVREAQKLL